MPSTFTAVPANLLFLDNMYLTREAKSKRNNNKKMERRHYVVVVNYLAYIRLYAHLFFFFPYSSFSFPIHSFVLSFFFFIV